MTESEFRALRAGDRIANRKTGKQHRVTTGHQYDDRGLEFIHRQQANGWGPRVIVYRGECDRWRVVTS